MVDIGRQEGEGGREGGREGRRGRERDGRGESEGGMEEIHWAYKQVTISIAFMWC